MNFDDAQVFGQPQLADEELPPYSPFQPTFLGDDLTATTTSDIASLQIRRPVSGCSSLWSMVEPTELNTTTNGPLTRATQVLEPTRTTQLTFEGFVQTRVSVVTDDDNKYAGYMFVDSRFETAQDAGGAVSAASRLVTKPDERILDFGLGSSSSSSSGENGIGENPRNNRLRVMAECRIVLPRTANVPLPALRLRLPTNSHLSVTNITHDQLVRLDIAAVSCVARLHSLSVHSLRVAIADGRMDIAQIAVNDRADFVAIKGEIAIAECTAGEVIRVNIPQGKLEMSDAKTKAMSIVAKGATTVVRTAAVDEISVQTVGGPVTLEDVTVATMTVESSNAPVRGSWAVSKALTIEASAAIVQGRLAVTGDEARIRIKTSSWPVRLAVNDDYKGYFDAKSVNSIVNFGLPGATFYKNLQNWRQGVIGISANVLEVESTDSPVVISTF